MLASIFLTALTSFSALAAALPNPLSGELAKRASLPSTFTWSSSGPLISPKDNKGIAAYKDPSIVFYNGKYHVFVSTASSSGYNLAYLVCPPSAATTFIDCYSPSPTSIQLDLLKLHIWTQQRSAKVTELLLKSSILHHKNFGTSSFKMAMQVTQQIPISAM